MRTLVYCTAYAATLTEWNQRYRPWLDAVRRMGIADQILIVDDGSPVIPGWQDMALSSGDDPRSSAAPTPGLVMLHRFSQRLGRLDVFDCPGWYRSYGFGIAYARHHGFDRVIHLESDAYLISDRMQDYARNFTEGWVALWTERYQFPELAIQFAAGKGLAAFHDFTRRPYAGLIGQVHEYVVPFTHVERGFVGDRYGETNGPIPRDIDYACQIPMQRELPYYWWWPDAARYRPDAVREADALTFDFGSGGNAGAIVGTGWSAEEPGIRWMTAYFSVLRLPALPHRGDYVLRFNVHPLLHRDVVPRQMLRVTLNGRPTADFQINGDLIIGTVLPAAELRRDGTDVIGLIHPDAAAPSLLDSGLSDSRVLSLALRYIQIMPISLA